MAALTQYVKGATDEPEGDDDVESDKDEPAAPEKARKFTDGEGFAADLVTRIAARAQGSD